MGIMPSVCLRILHLRAQIKGRSSTYAKGQLDGLEWVYKKLKKHYKVWDHIKAKQEKRKNAKVRI